MRKLLVLYFALSLFVCLPLAVYAQTFDRSVTYTWTAVVDGQNNAFEFEMPASPFGSSTHTIVFGLANDSIWPFGVTPDDNYRNYIGSGTYPASLFWNLSFSTEDRVSNSIDWEGSRLHWYDGVLNVYPVSPGGDYTGSIHAQAGDPTLIGFDASQEGYDPTHPHTLNFSIDGRDVLLFDEMNGVIVDRDPVSGNTGTIQLQRQYENCQETFTISATYWASAVPEPSSLAALLCGLGGLGTVVFRRRR